MSCRFDVAHEQGAASTACEDGLETVRLAYSQASQA